MESILADDWAAVVAFEGGEECVVGARWVAVLGSVDGAKTIRVLFLLLLLLFWWWW